MASFESDMPFPEVVRRLVEAGVERYHTDLMLQTKTYHGQVGGRSYVELFPHFTRPEIPETFSEAGVKEAIRASQQRQIRTRSSCVALWLRALRATMFSSPVAKLYTSAATAISTLNRSRQPVRTGAL